MRPPPDGVSTGNVIANTWSEHNPAYAELVGYMKLHHFWMATSPKGGFDSFITSIHDFLATQRNFKNFILSLNCHFCRKIAKIITKVNSLIFKDSPYI